MYTSDILTLIMPCEICGKITNEIKTHPGYYYRRCWTCKSLPAPQCEAGCGKTISINASKKGFTTCYNCKDRVSAFRCEKCKKIITRKYKMPVCVDCTAEEMVKNFNFDAIYGDTDQTSSS